MKKNIIGVIGVVIIYGGFNVYFNRAPERITPESGIVSPASGKIIGIISATTPNITFTKKGIENTVSIPELSGAMHMVLIEMNPMDVHVQRAPISGSIIEMEHYDGRHINAIGKEKMNIVNTNEKTVTVFKNETDTVGVIQVAGKAARRIRNYVGINESVSVGQIYGRILLGSQVVMLIPEKYSLLVQEGQRVTDGQTLIAE